jgi:hypothetical protein
MDHGRTAFFDRLPDQRFLFMPSALSKDRIEPQPQECSNHRQQDNFKRHNASGPFREKNRRQPSSAISYVPMLCPFPT